MITTLVYDMKYKPNALERLIAKLFKRVNIHKEYQYALKKVVHDKTVMYFPVAKEPGIGSAWRPIVKLYDEYIILDHEKTGGLGETEALDHIYRFQLQIQEKVKKETYSIDYNKVGDLISKW